MVRLMMAALVAMGLSMTARTLRRERAKGCGKGYHVNKKGPVPA